MKRILILLPWLPYPLSSGGNQGVFNMLKAISSSYEVHLWFLADVSVDEKLINSFLSALDNKIIIHYTIKKPGLNMATLRGIHYRVDKLLLRHDTTFKSNQSLWGKETSSKYDDFILSDIIHLIDKYRIDIVQVEFVSIIDYVYCLPSKVKKIFIHHELGFARKQTQLKQKNNRSFYDDFMLARSTDREISALNKYDAVVTLTDVDKEKLKQFGVSTSIYVSPLFIPKSVQVDFVPANNRLVMIGGGNHYPNVEGIRWFIEKVHPLLEKHIDYKLEVIGGNWDSKKPQNVPSNIVFLGFVEDLSKVVPGSVMIVPILTGSGMRMKILEAVNNSVPFVSTSIGAEGLNFVDSRDCDITDSPSEFSDRIIRLLKDKELQRKYVTNSLNVYENEYSASVLSNKRIDILNLILNN